MIANIQGNVLHAIGSNQYAQVTKANRLTENNQIRENRFETAPVQEGMVRTSVDGDVLTISPQGNAYADRAADVTAAVVDRSRITQTSAVATDERVKAFVGAEEKDELSEAKSCRAEAMEKKRKEQLESLEDVDLSGYTDSELAGMLSRGEISRAEYEKEANRRESYNALTGVSA